MNGHPAVNLIPDLQFTLGVNLTIKNSTFHPQATNAESTDLESTAEESSVEDATEDYWAGSGTGPDEDTGPTSGGSSLDPSTGQHQQQHNETRESLTHEASDQEAVSKTTKRP